jgi:uncharacterized membrane protein
VLITADIITPNAVNYTQQIDTYISRPGSTALEHLPGPSTQGSDMNDFGEVIGTDNVLTPNPRAYVYYNGLFEDLGVLPGYTESSGDCINNLGQTVGTVYSQELGGHVWVNLDGTMRLLETLLSPKDKGWIINDVSQLNDEGRILAGGVLNGVAYNVLLTPNVNLPAVALP